jgi:hypothetical protein
MLPFYLQKQPLTQISVSEQIPQTIERLNEALSVSPDNEYIMHLLSRAQELMTKENVP